MSLSHSPSIVRNGLVLYLDAANSRSYPGTGTTWTDLSGNENNFTLFGGAAYNSQNNGGLIFDGTDDYAEVTNNSNTRFSHNTAWSFSIFYKPITQNTTYPGLMRLGISSTSGILMFYVDNAVIWKHNNTQTNITNRDLGIVKNITLTYSGSGNILAYVNGIFAVNVHTMSSTDTSSNFGLGIGDQYGNVQIYNFLKYNVQLTAAQVLQNYNALKGRYGL